MQTQALLTSIMDVLADAKLVDVQLLDVTQLTYITEFMIVASGTSERHVKASSEKLAQALKMTGIKPNIEGLDDGQWVVIDFNDVVVHVMHPVTRTFYQLEKLWSPVEQTKKEIIG